MKKHVYREGDLVEIVNSRFIKRVGYPLVFTELFEEFQNHPNLMAAMDLLGLVHRSYRVRRDFIEGAAKAAVRSRGWGGRERSLHYYETLVPDGTTLSFGETIPDYTGQTTKVYHKRTAMTGTYYPPSGSEEDYEPGGLFPQKAHVILTTDFGNIEACDVKPVE